MVAGMDNEELTPKQLKFVEEYLLDHNAKGAAIRAGYAEIGAATRGHKMLHNPKVQTVLQQRLKARAAAAKDDVDAIITELKRIAFGDVRGVLSWGPQGVHIKPSDSLSDAVASTVAEVSEAPGRLIKIKQHDKMKALELLGRHLGMWNDKVKVSGDADAPLNISVTFVDPE